MIGMLSFGKLYDGDLNDFNVSEKSIREGIRKAILKIF